MKVLVGYDGGSVGPMEIAAGLRGLAEPVFLVPAELRQTRLGQMVAALAETVAFAGGTDPAGDALLEPAKLDRLAGIEGLAGALTFSEKLLPALSQVTTRLGLPGHAAETIRLLTDKYAQRRALRDSGVDPVRCQLLDSPAALDPAVEQVGFPAVLKPVRGRGSRNTYLVADRGRLAELVHQLLVPAQPGQPPAEQALLLEEYLPGDPSCPQGDYVAVESVVCDGVVEHLAVTGKFPQLSGFREVGDFWPAGLAGPVSDRVERLVSGALGALGVRTGICHTEVKLTPAGPRIIEVNGRLGGEVSDLARAAYGLDVSTLAARIALGLPVSLPARELPAVVYTATAIAPLPAVRLRAVRGADRIRQQPGVFSYRRYREVGSTTRTAEAACTLDVLTGQARSHAELTAAVREATSTLSYEFDMSDGTIATFTGWQLTLGSPSGSC
ncbi:ATP-grasp domain-containing protein [Jatrophihabitans sp.]|uniref:ATP-grasp domain-containing protein n=1 Tax=Jatrophihabitans sp. TaxID=1932789 RepID=UPI002CAEF66A|nr:ATP-grasp domain-containing protein [Jatrophihabitans sp.]